MDEHHGDKSHGFDPIDLGPTRFVLASTGHALLRQAPPFDSHVPNGAAPSPEGRTRQASLGRRNLIHRKVPEKAKAIPAPACMPRTG